MRRSNAQRHRRCRRTNEDATPEKFAKDGTNEEKQCAETPALPTQPYDVTPEKFAKDGTIEDGTNEDATPEKFAKDGTN